MGGDPSLKVPFHEKLMVGAVAGVIGTMSIFPIDMVKTRLQNQTVGADGTPPCASPIAPPSVPGSMSTDPRPLPCGAHVMRYNS